MRRTTSELNAGYDGNGAPTCNDEHSLLPDDGNDTVEYQDWLRWVPDFENDPTPPTDGPSNEWYRQICYIPDLPPRPGPPLGEAWQRFEFVAPEIIARVAIDDMLTDIPEHTIRTSPETEGLVAVDTLVLDRRGAARARACAGERAGHAGRGDRAARGRALRLRRWRRARLRRPRHPVGARGRIRLHPDLSRSPAATAITATIVWTGSYTVNGGPPIPLETVVARTDAFDLPVNEAQAINTRAGG